MTDERERVRDDEIERVREALDSAAREATGHDSGLIVRGSTSAFNRFVELLAKRLQPKPELGPLRNICGKCGGVDHISRNEDGMTCIFHNCQPKPHGSTEAERIIQEVRAGNAQTKAILDEIDRRMRQEYPGEYARHTEFQPKPEPPKKVWSVSDATAGKAQDHCHAHISARNYQRWRIMTVEERSGQIAALNAIAADIIRERPDLVAAEWERRYRDAREPCVPIEGLLQQERRSLFPELTP